MKLKIYIVVSLKVTSLTAEGALPLILLLNILEVDQQSESEVLCCCVMVLC